MTERQEEDWMYCTMCRSGRLSREALKRARAREVTWEQPRAVPLRHPICEPVVPTTLEDAFQSVMRLMKESTKQCKRYHNYTGPHPRGSPSDVHSCRYHSEAFQSSAITNRLGSLQKEKVHVSVAPGTYAVTAAREGGEEETSHRVTLEPGQAVTITLSIN